MSWATLYRYFDAGGDLLYVGISKHPTKRLGQHRDKPWWTLIASATFEHFDSRQDAELAEMAAIWIERPVHNKMGQADPSRSLFELAVDADPRLDEVMVACARIGLHQSDGCANARWFGVQDGPIYTLKRAIGVLVGVHAADPRYPWMATAETYEAVYQVAYSWILECHHPGASGCWAVPGDDTVERLLRDSGPGIHVIDLIEAQHSRDERGGLVSLRAAMALRAGGSTS